MPNNIANAHEDALLDASLLNTDKVGLLWAQGDDATDGSEVSGAPYARQTVTWAASAGGSKATSADLNFTMADDYQLMGWAVYTSAGARKWYGYFSQIQGSAQATGDTITAAAHGLANGTKICFQPGYTPTSGSLNPNTTYVVRDATTDTFKVAFFAGGAAVDITADTALVIIGQVITVPAGQTFKIAAGELVCSLS